MRQYCLHLAYFAALHRLRNADANAQVDVVMEEEYVMALPEHDQFKDLHGGMLQDFPKVTLGRISTYLSQFEKVFEEKCKALYEER